MRLARKSSGWTQKQLADRAGYDVSVISRIERDDQTVAPRTVAMVCAAVSVPFDLAAAIREREGVEDWSGVSTEPVTLIEPPTYDQAIAAADWVYVHEEGEESMEVVRQGLFRVRISGRCMEPKFPDGSIVEFRVVRLNGTPQIEEGAAYYVQRSDGAATFKLAYQLPTGDGIELRAINRKVCRQPLRVEWQEIARLARAVAIHVPV